MHEFDQNERFLRLDKDCGPLFDNFRYFGISVAIEEEPRYIKLQLKDDDFKKGFGLIRKWGEKDRQGIFRSKTNSADGKGHIYHDKRAKRF